MTAAFLFHQAIDCIGKDGGGCFEVSENQAFVWLVDDDIAVGHGHAVGDGVGDDVGVGEAADGEGLGRVAGVVAVDVKQGGDEGIVRWDVMDVFHTCWFADDAAKVLA